jgi:hypothetical protein
LQPFYGGKKDQIVAEIFPPNDKRPFCTVQGEWNGVMYAKFADSPTQSEVFLDTKNTPVMKKLVKPLDEQGEFESRR